MSISHLETPLQSKVVLTLVDIFNDVLADPEGKNIAQLVQDKVLASACPARTFLKLGNGDAYSHDDVVSIQKQVLRFLQVKDKYSDLASKLLKSQAFHIAYELHNNNNTTTNNNTSLMKSSEHRTVVDLPRTKYKKPYIPWADSKNSEPNSYDNGEEDWYPLSVSHQFPYVGTVRLDDETFKRPYSKVPLVGMDLVVFDEFNSRLYSNEDEFLLVFKESFTETEWGWIQSSSSSLSENMHDSCRLKEFYVRWAMKEAYTKAIGVGMGLSFNKFEISLYSPNSPENAVISRLWRSMSYNQDCDVIRRNNSDGNYFFGLVTHLEGEKKPESWEFFFLPLADTASGNYKGCACICIRSLSTKSDRASCFQTTVIWTTLSSLIEWHQPRPLHLHVL